MFEIVNNVIENLVFAIFICSYIGIKEKRNIYIVTTVIINAIISTILTSMNIIGITQTFVIQFVFCLGLYIVRKKLYIKDIVVSIFCNILLILGNYLSYFSLSFIFNTTPLGLLSNKLTYIILVVLVRITQIVLCYLVYKNRLLPEINPEDKKINLMLLFEMVFLMVVIFYFVNIVLTSEFNLTINIVYVCFIALFIIFYIIVNDYLKVKSNLYTQVMNDQKEKYINENVRNLKRIKDDIRNTEHKINYILQLIEFDLNNKDYEQAKKKLNIVKELVYKIQPALHTGNEVFDFMINMKVKEIYSMGKQMKISSFISNNSIYNQYSTYNNIVDILDIVCLNTDLVELYLSEDEGHRFDVKIIFKFNKENKEETIKRLYDLNISLNIAEGGDILIVRFRKKLYESD